MRFLGFSSLIHSLFGVPIMMKFIPGFFIFVLSIILIPTLMILIAKFVIPIFNNNLTKLSRLTLFRMDMLSIFLIGFLFARILTWIFPFLGFDIVGVIYYILLIFAYGFIIFLYFSHFFKDFCCTKCNKWSTNIVGRVSLGIFKMKSKWDVEHIKETTYASGTTEKKVIGVDHFERTDDVEKYQDHIECKFCGQKWYVDRERIINFGEEIKKWF